MVKSKMLLMIFQALFAMNLLAAPMQNPRSCKEIDLLLEYSKQFPFKGTLQLAVIHYSGLDTNNNSLLKITIIKNGEEAEVEYCKISSQAKLTEILPRLQKITIPHEHIQLFTTGKLKFIYEMTPLWIESDDDVYYVVIVGVSDYVIMKIPLRSGQKDFISWIRQIETIINKCK